MKNKRMIIISVFLIVILILNSCSNLNNVDNAQNTGTQNNENQESGNNGNNDSQVNSDIYGSAGEFMIKSGIVSEVTLAPAANINDRGDKILAHYKNIEKLFNCKITAMAILPETMENDILTANATISKYADIIETNANMIYNLYKAGFLSALQEFPEIDPSSEKWGYSGSKEFMTFEPDKTYGFRGLYLATSVPTISNVLFYNTNILNQYSAPDPYEFYEQNTWNWQNFEEIAKAVSSKVSDDQSVYAFVTPNEKYPAFFNSAIYSNGGRRLLLKEDGTYYCGYNDIPTINALNWVYNLVTNYKVSYTMLDNPRNSIMDILAFTNLRTAFLVSNSYTGVSADEAFPLNTFGDNFKWIEFPRGPSGNISETTAFLTPNDQFCAIIANKVIDASKKGEILNAVFDPPEGENENSWKNYLNKNYFFYEQDFNSYLKMLQNARSDDSLKTLDIENNLNGVLSMVIQGYKTPKEAVSEIGSVIDTIINK